MKKYISEFLGTAILVLFGCGTACLAGNFVGTLGIAIAFGLGLIIAGMLIGDISGCHINPAVSLAMLLTKKISLSEFLKYVVAQVLGALFGTFLIAWIITSANMGSVESVGLGANAYGELSTFNLSAGGAFLTEVILTFIFILVILKVTNDKTKSNSAIFIIGLTLFLVHIIGIPLTGTSVNPARSLAPALFLGKEALKQVWLFICAPLVGAIIAVIVYKLLFENKKEKK